MRTKYTNEDIDFLKKYYPIGDWDAIFARFPNLDKEKIYNVCHKRGISANYYERDKLLKAESYKTSIQNRKKWNDNEIEILINNYSIMPVVDIMKLLPERTYDSIVLKAKKLSLKSFIRQQQLYSDNDIVFIESNWQCMSDEEMAIALNRTRRAIKAARNNIGLFRQDKEKTHYENLTKFLRGQISQWKKQSIKECGFKCVLTGSKDFAIHHIISFNVIVKNFISEHNIVLKDNFEDYTTIELNKISDMFLQFHNTYPLGVCVEKNLHMKFHQMYGDINTEEQWHIFVDKFNKGEILH
jgi:hypothetical protein